MDINGGLLQGFVAAVTVLTAIWFYIRQRKGLTLLQSLYLKPTKLNKKQSSLILKTKCMRTMSTNSYAFEEPKYKKDPDVDEGELIGVNPRELDE